MLAWRPKKAVCFPRGAKSGVASFLLLNAVWLAAASAQTDVNRARQALDAGQIAEAIRLLEPYQDAHSASAEVYNLLGIAYGRSGDSDRAVTMFQEYARLAPNRPQAFNNLGAAYLQSGNPEKAQSAFRQALKLDPTNTGALYNLGSLLNAEKQYAESRTILGRAYQREQSTAIAYELAFALAGTGERKRALRVLSASKPPAGPPALPWLRLTGTLHLDEGNLAAASQALESAVALAPGDEASVSALALLRVKEGKPEAAVALLERTYKALPAEQSHIRVGSLLAVYGVYPQAIEQFERAAQENPYSYDALYNIAALKLDRTKDLAGSLAAAERASALRNTAEIHSLLGDIHEAQGSFLEAIDNYQEAVRLDPKNDKFVFDLGAELILHENYAAALALFQSAEQRFPRSSRIFLGLGTLQFLTGKTDESVGAFLKAVDLNPAFEPAYVFLGEACAFSGTRSKEVALKLASVAAKEPKNFGVQYYYGAVLIRQMEEDGNLEHAAEADAALGRAALLKPTDARVFYQRGELRRLQKRLADSVADYQTAIELDPNFPEPLYKLGQAYLKLHKTRESQQIFARHKEVLARMETNLHRRSSEIQSFVLKMRKDE
jgi:tetratricopeptide (TPR) repeat protein